MNETLLDTAAAFREIAADQYTTFHRPLFDIPRELFVERVVELAQERLPDTELFRQIVREFYLPSELAEAFRKHCSEHRARQLRAVSDASTVLESLRQTGMKLAAIANEPVDVASDRLRAAGLNALSHVLVVAQTEERHAPEPETFWETLAQLNVRSDQAWFVGSHPALDVEAALAAGLRAIWRRTRYHASPELPVPTIRSLSELPALLASADALNIRAAS